MISVIIPTHDQWPRLRLVLLGLTRVRTREAWELIVVDDGSATPVAELVAGDARLAVLPLRVERLEPNLGRSVARNRGVEVARGDVCLFLDGDAVPHPDWLEHHARRYRRGARIFTLGHIRTIAETEHLADPASVVTDDQVLAAALHDRSTWGSVPMSPAMAARWLAWLVDPLAEPLLCCSRRSSPSTTRHRPRGARSCLPRA